MSIVDDYGRHEANPQLLRSLCYPLQTDLVRVADISRWMAACQKTGVILHYEVAGKQYLQIEKFGQQQRSASKCPDPIASASKCSQAIADAHLDVSVSVMNSVAKATDGKPSPVETKSKADMAKSDLWKAAVSVLEAGGCPKAQARTFMGKLVGDYGFDAVQQAVAAAVTAQPAEAREYLKAACQRLKGERRDPVTVPSDAADRTAAMLRQQADHARQAVPPPANIRALVRKFTGGAA